MKTFKRNNEWAYSLGVFLIRLATLYKYIGDVASITSFFPISVFAGNIPFICSFHGNCEKEMQFEESSR